MVNLAHPQPVLSIVTVNYNGTNDTLELLESIGTSTLERIEVIVVDNGSNEDPTTEVQSKFPEVQVLRSDKTLVSPVEITWALLGQRANM